MFLRSCIVLVVATLFALFSTMVLGYISMAVPIGPWITPTLALFALMIGSLFPYLLRKTDLINAVVAGSLGGIIATAIGFSFPAIYFLDPSVFTSWIATPLSMIGMVSSTALCASLFGVLIVEFFGARLLDDAHCTFPIGQLLYNTVMVGSHAVQTVQLRAGIVCASLISLLQKGVIPLITVPSKLMLYGGGPSLYMQIPALVIDVWPMLWAIGFIAGHVITVPLAIGALSKIVVVDPLYVALFTHLSVYEFLLSFCGGMMLVATASSFLGLPRMVATLIRQVSRGSRTVSFSALYAYGKQYVMNVLLGVGVLVVTSGILWYQNFSFTEQVYLYMGTALFSYQLMVIGGKWGIAPLGRFATFVMLPAYAVFGTNPIKLALIATFVEVAGGVAVDLLFGRKAGQLAGIPSRQIRWYQWYGIFIATASVGIIFYVLVHAFGLGTAQLFAYKAQSRYLLINTFDSHGSLSVSAALCGGIFGALMMLFGSNVAMVMGGLLMPLNISIGLMIGGLMTYVLRPKSFYEPFWSGVCAADSLLMLLYGLLGWSL